MAQLQSIKSLSPLQDHFSTSDVVSDTGWRDSGNLLVRTIIVGHQQSELRKKWFEQMTLDSETIT